MDLDLVSRDSRAQLSTIGGSIRSLVLDGISVIPSYPPGPPPLSAGIVLVPWPDRVEGARWTHEGQSLQLPVTEPGRGHALHGLLAHAEYSVAAQTPDSVRLEASIPSSPGYPFDLDTAVTYALDAAGLTTTHEIVNRGSASAPVALGAHPYFRIGGTPLEDHVLTIAASERFVLDDSLVPRGRASVEGEADFRGGRPVDATGLHYALTDLDGSAHNLSAGGATVQIWTDPNFAVVQIFVATAFPGGPALAIEPLTAPANALNSGEGLRWLEPGETWTLRWGVRLG